MEPSTRHVVTSKTIRVGRVTRIKSQLNELFVTYGSKYIRADVKS